MVRAATLLVGVGVLVVALSGPAAGDDLITKRGIGFIMHIDTDGLDGCV
jgi:hypothetical protein